MVHPLVTTQWLANHLDTPNLIILDASMSRVIGREPIVYDQPMFIPGSQAMDLDDAFCNPSATEVHGFPSQERFTREARKLGINAGTTVVLYDNQGVYSAPRAWWIFKAMGHEKAFVLDGGLPKWLAESREVADHLAAEPARPGNITGIFEPRRVCDSNYLVETQKADQVTVVDARSAERFAGTAPEPREGVRSGHIPGSRNLPFAEVLDEHTFKSAEQLNAIFAQTLPPGNQQTAFSCGSGVTACILLLAFEIAGYKNNVLYDGSWADWGSNVSLPVATAK